MGMDYALVWLLAVYGLFCFFVSIFKLIDRKKYHNEKANLILVVKDQEDNIEGIIRDAVNNKFVRGIALTGRFTVLDMGSTDDTLKILKKLEQEYPLLDICTYEERDKVLN